MAKMCVSLHLRIFLGNYMQFSLHSIKQNLAICSCLAAREVEMCSLYVDGRGHARAWGPEVKIIGCHLGDAVFISPASDPMSQKFILGHSSPNDLTKMHT